MENKSTAKMIVGCVGTLAVFGACAVTGSIGGLWGLVLVIGMMEAVG